MSMKGDESDESDPQRAEGGAKEAVHGAERARHESEAGTE